MGQDAVARTIGEPTTVTDPELARFLEDCLASIRRHFSPSALILFGSRADDTADEWSDIDLVLVSTTFRGQHLLDRMQDFDDRVDPHRHVDALCLTPEEFEDRVNRPTIIREAFRTGIRVI